MSSQSLSENRALFELYFSNIFKSKEHQECAIDELMREITSSNIEKYNLIMDKFNKLVERTVIFE